MITTKQLIEGPSSNEFVADASARGQEKFLKPILLGLFIIWTVNFFIKTALDKHLSLDGVNYFFHILENRGFVNISWSRRYTEYLTEWPLVLSLLGGITDIRILIKIFALGIYFPYLVSFLLCWYVTDDKNRSLLLFPLGSLIGFNLLSDYDLIADHHVLAVMTWPILLLLVKERPLQWIEGILLWILLIAYSRMYETAVLTALIMTIFSLSRIYLYRIRREQIINGISIVLLGLVAYISIKYIFDPRSPTNRGAFLDSILVNRRNWEALSTNIFLAIICTGWLISSKQQFIKNLVFVSALGPIIVYAVSRIVYPEYQPTAYLSFSSRTLIGIIIPGSMVFLGLIVLGKREVNWVGLGTFVLGFLVMILFNIYDLRHWNNVRNEFSSIRNSGEMYVAIENTALGDSRLDLRHHRWSWNNPLLSLVWAEGCVRTIVLNESDGPQGPFDPQKKLVLKHYLKFESSFKAIDSSVEVCRQPN